MGLYLKTGAIFSG